MEQKPLFESRRDWNKEFEAYLQENKTLAYMMLKKSEEFKDFVALSQKNKNNQWESITWNEFGSKIKAIAKALIDLKLQPGEMCAIFSQNRAEWAIADLGILATRAVSVPIYATNSKEEAEYIIDDAEVKIIFTGDQAQYDKAKAIIADNKHLKLIVAFDRDTKISGNDSIYFDELIDKGNKLTNDEEFKSRLNTVNPDDILTLIYTSGTTGKPKGAIHTHRSFMNGIYPSYMRFPEAGPGIVSLAILPLSHVFERMWSYGCMSAGVQIAYCPDPKQFVDVMSHVKPHFMTSVPRIWEKVYGTIHEGLKDAPPIKRKLFAWATKVGIEEYRKKVKTGKGQSGLKYKIADKLIFSKVRAKLGTERCMVYHIGGAAFAPEINEFFQAFGINIIQGYGLTEFFPVCVGYRDTGKPAWCGPVIPMCNVRISDEGEIQLKGGMCMSGYYKKPEETKACFTEDGWFKTQDVGEIMTEEKYDDRLTYIKITDRIKDLIITAGGKNISPQQIEVLLGDELYIEQFVTIGEGRKFISALVVPNFVILEEYCQKNNIPFTSREEVIKNPQIIKLYEDIIEKRTESLGQVEKIKKFTLLTSELTQEGGELTPTMKLKRKFINQKYKDIIDKMYEE
ncbi:MAG: Long-chain-fatty-acid--CoA ligase FadD15 [Spirochaetes bacterium ADurb.Bin218]|jgi:long-chain acyl-CoA synthetase|nr:long-chain fatty acid--CoA ligase [Spirochaetota bacterium]OQA99900.1 MAG: Long-chain-fatty-acid--CoA ligase FadD15 [Spirochaetes bacterium ADurb.Bin218]HOQ13121.1 long-chain fatty acid--CoA ligase [Spirochaetota bacterium]HPX90197.1 long-chain fatty acid--CoA ligase [Spirochaetota bacterium]HRU65287.1 long-chain fatty acid--CoA ligase [Spirochaetota bacterium]